MTQILIAFIRETWAEYEIAGILPGRVGRSPPSILSEFV